MYAVRFRICSSVISPWNVGITGWYPATIFAFGCKIDSRIYASSATTVDPSASGTLPPNTPFNDGARPIPFGR
jgi:hypothetical protein